MTTDERADPILRRLAGLPSATPDPVRAQRVRARCAATLTRRAASVRPTTRRDSLVECLVVGGFSFVYLIALIADLARVYGLL